LARQIHITGLLWQFIASAGVSTAKMLPAAGFWKARAGAFFRKRQIVVRPRFIAQF